MTDRELSFAELEKRICAMPEGPASVLNTPRWIAICNVVGMFGIVIGLMPSVLIKFLEPQMWMVYMARAGVWAAYVGFAPYMLRTTLLVASNIWRWKAEQVKQLDHDLVEFRKLNRELAEFPKELLEEHVRFAQMIQARLTSKLGLLVGSLDKLGVIPLLIALGIVLRDYGDPTAIPTWLAVLGMFLVITYLIAWVAAHMRLRVQLYETVLSEALERKGG